MLKKLVLSTFLAAPRLVGLDVEIELVHLIGQLARQAIASSHDGRKHSPRKSLSIHLFCPLAFALVSSLLLSLKAPTSVSETVL